MTTDYRRGSGSELADGVAPPVTNTGHTAKAQCDCGPRRSSNFTVTICGSMRHFDAMLTEAGRLTAAGMVVHLPVPVPDGTDADLLDLVHRRKIDASDAVHVVNPGHYVGSATTTEIAYAVQRRLPVTYSDPLPHTCMDIDPRGCVACRDGTTVPVCLGEPTCYPPDGEVTADGREYGRDGRHAVPCPHAKSG